MVLRVNLTTGEIEKEVLTKDLRLSFIGGSGINAKILYDEVDPEIDPFDPENRLIFGAGPLSGTTAPSTGRISATTKCPFTFAFADSSAGGSFGAELKRAGFEHVVISGKSERLSYLLIDDEHAELRNAEHLAMKDVFETDEIIKKTI